MIQKIVVVGGGTAGWLTALMAKQSNPEMDITLIESSEIGILGAGEGSVPSFIEFLKYLDIKISDLVKSCDATIKNAIKFTNWNNDNDFYYHGFASIDPQLSFDALSSKRLPNNPLATTSIYLNNSLNQINFPAKISENNKVPYINEKLENNSSSGYQKINSHAIHFNASKLASKLKEIGIDRNIKVIDGEVNTISIDQNNNIESLTLKDGSKIFCDFVFDCSGFHRIIIGKLFNSKWNSYKDFLPVDAAVPFFIDMEDQIPPYTEAIAMKYGWIWKIPLQNRFGCGYVYDSSLISEEEAVKEIEEFLGYEPIYPRKDKGGFRFNAGCYEEPWINNCVAIGLSAGFIEPLEATSLGVTTTAIEKILNNSDWIVSNTKEVREEFNKYMVHFNHAVANFIYFHYMGLRKDTKFWEKFSYENAPQDLKQKLILWKSRIINHYDRDKDNHWLPINWLIIASGIKMIDSSIAKKYINSSQSYDHVINMYDYYVNYQNYKSYECMNHKEFLESLK